MVFDGYTLRCLTIELRKSLINGRIEKIYQPRRDTLLFHLRTGNGRERLLLSANPSNPRVHLTIEGTTGAQHPPMFCMLLRKHLQGGTILSIEQHGLDRVLEFTIRATNQLGEQGQKHLVCEIMGRHSNIILLNQSGSIIDSVKRVTAQMSSYRHIFPGMEYKSPPSQSKLDISIAGPKDLERAFLAHLGTKAAKAVSGALEGMGTVLAREICTRGGIDPDRPLCEPSIPALGEAALVLAAVLEKEDFYPVIYYRDKRVFDFSPILLTHLILPYERQPSINAMMAKFFREKTDTETLNREKDHLLRVVGSLTEKKQKKLNHRLQEERTAAGKDHYRLYGELITANLYRLKDKTDLVVLEDYNKPDSPIVKIKLDPDLTPLQNAQSFFKEYNHAKRTIGNLEKLIRQTREEIDYLEGLSYSLENCTKLDELREIRIELERGGYVNPAKAAGKAGKKGKQKETPCSGPLAFKSQDGFAIYVGRNNRQNDYLTQRFARKDDLWLHTKDIPGSHVLIRSEGKEIPDTTLYEAALLSAYNSKARRSGSVPVDYTFAKHVSKPTGAKPGFVIYKNQKTVFVTPNSEEIDRIKRLKS
ncbi:MAG: NFACT RNA binding domain-containing protein [Bacillota bacterium]